MVCYRACLLAGLFVFAPVLAPAQVTLQADRQYAAGSRISSPWTGVTIEVPAGFTAAYDREVQALLMASDPHPQITIGVYAYSEIELGEIAAVIEPRLAEVGIYLTPSGEPEIDDTTARGWYRAQTPSGFGILYGAARRGDLGNAVAVLALGPESERQALESRVESILSSARFSQPQAERWRAAAAGRAFVGGSSHSDFSPGVDAATGASQSSSRLDLCSDGTYAYEYRSESYVSIEGASAERTESDAHDGRWWLVADIIGNAYLVLETDDGRGFHWRVVEQENGLQIDGMQYTPAPDRRCP